MSGIKYDHALAQAIVDTIREPLLVLDEDLRVVAASRSFHTKFNTTRASTEGRFLYALGCGEWNIPALRQKLKDIAPDESVLEDYEVELVFPEIGRRIMCLNARKVFYEHGAHTTILLAIEDITERHTAQQERDHLLRDKELLLLEMQHRVANSLQIIASILLMKARSVGSEETRSHLQDAHKRVLAVAAVQKHLRATTGDDTIELSPYLTQLCDSLAGSMIGDHRTISIEARVDDSGAKSSDAVSIGLIVTELVINALKHAFPLEKAENAIVVSFAGKAPDWRLKVCDNGVGKDQQDGGHAGLGTSIIAALADQLQSRVESVSGPSGTAVIITHAVEPAAVKIPARAF